MVKDAFTEVSQWVFDLDNTLYPPQMGLFDQIEIKMTEYVMTELGVTRAEADRLRSLYWREHGTTLAGLMREHDIDPRPYLVAVHDVDMTHMTPTPGLAERIRALPGRRIVYTNGSAPYAERVLAARGLGGLFDAIYGVEHAGFRPKPERAAFEQVFEQAGITPTRAAMFEDDPRNLSAPHDMGMRTILVAPERHDGDHIHHQTVDLKAFLDLLN